MVAIGLLAVENWRLHVWIIDADTCEAGLVTRVLYPLGLFLSDDISWEESFPLCFDLGRVDVDMFQVLNELESVQGEL
jgi:hypothetical protein